MWPSTAAGDEHHRYGPKAQSPNPNHAKDIPDLQDATSAGAFGADFLAHILPFF
jgi:hypothetical protein